MTPRAAERGGVRERVLHHSHRLDGQLEGRNFMSHTTRIMPPKNVTSFQNGLLLYKYLEHELGLLVVERQHPLEPEKVRAVLLYERLHELVEKVDVQASSERHSQGADLPLFRPPIQESKETKNIGDEEKDEEKENK